MYKFKVEGGRPLSGTVDIAGNKNEALPALLTCLLTDSPLTLTRIPRIGDVLTLCEILIDLGVKIDWHDEQSLTLHADKVNKFTPKAELCAKARASILFLGPLLARMGKVDLASPGGDVIGARRIDTHFEGLEALGAQIKLGAKIQGSIGQIIGTDIYLDEPSVTATENIVMLAVLAEGTTQIHNAACEPHVQGLCRLLNAMGAKISGIGSNLLVIKGVSKLTGTNHEIGPDFMEVGSFICLGAIGKGRIRINRVNPEDMRFTLKTYKKLGINIEMGKDFIDVDGSNSLQMKTDISGRIGSIYSSPWPGFPTDLMSVSIVAATQASGTIIFFEKMYEGRMFFTDNLMAMGANIVLCDPHRVVITGPQPLVGTRMSSPDVRAGMALLMAALIAKGSSEIHNIYQIERGYNNIESKLQNLGAAITKVMS